MTLSNQSNSNSKCLFVSFFVCMFVVVVFFGLGGGGVDGMVSWGLTLHSAIFQL